MTQELLKERGRRYGRFEDNATLSQTLKIVVREHMKGRRSPVILESIEMILHKIARICNGDPEYVDSWEDIAGYATLVVNHLKERDGQRQAKEIRVCEEKRKADAERDSLRLREESNPQHYTGVVQSIRHPGSEELEKANRVDISRSAEEYTRPFGKPLY